MVRLLLCLPLIALGCSQEARAPLPLAVPEAEGPLTPGKWEQRQKDGLSFWPPSRGATRLPELIDFSCADGANELRLTLTGDTGRTAVWMAEDRKSARRAIVVTSEGVTELDIHAGQQRLPSVQVPLDADWLQPLLAREGRFAINAYGTRVYRLEATKALADTIERCRGRG